MVKAIDAQLLTPRHPGPQFCGTTQEKIGVSKVLCPDELKDRWESKRRAVDDPNRNDGLLSLFAPEDRIDGYLVGGDKKLYPPNASLRTLPALKASYRDPDSEVEPQQRVDLIHINGIGTPAAGQFDDMIVAADTLSKKDGMQAEIRGIHNGTDGMLRDVLQAAGDKFGFGKNRPAETLKNKVLDRVLEGAPVNLLVHSHGTIIASRALKEAKLTLQMEHGKTRAQAEKMLGDVVRVVTTGNATWRYPDGPKYLHVMNTRDTVSLGVGLGSSSKVPKAEGMGLLRVVGKALAVAGRMARSITERDFGPVYQPGKDHQMLTFEHQSRGGAKGLIRNHSFAETYMPFMRKHLGQIMGDEGRAGFFLPASYRAPGFGPVVTDLKQAVA